MIIRYGDLCIRAGQAAAGHLLRLGWREAESMPDETPNSATYSRDKGYNGPNILHPAGR